MGVGSSLIYAPAFYAGTDELVELMRAAAEHGGMYISHIRSEANHLLEAIDELVEIARRSGAPAEIYHLKASGAANWPKLEAAIARVEAARAAGLRITADMYTYTAGSTGLSATMPPWVQEGGHGAWISRLQDPTIRARVKEEMRTPTDAWENMFLLPSHTSTPRASSTCSSMVCRCSRMVCTPAPAQAGWSAARALRPGRPVEATSVALCASP